jgi:dTDP-glucose 4,6-dehydratase
VRVLDNFATGHKSNIEEFFAHPKFELVEGDIRVYEDCLRACDGIDAISHQAALGSVPRSISDPRASHEVNVNGFINILEAARANNIKRLVYASSSSVYGDLQESPKVETRVGKVLSPYAATKVAADQLAHSYWASFELPVVTLRPFNVFGPRQSTRAVIPTIITQLIKGTGTISIGNLTSTRDMNFVKDTVRAFDIAISAAGAVGRTFNIGTGYEVSIEDLAKQIGKILGKDVEFKVDEHRRRPEKSEVERLVSDSRLAGDILGWHLNHSPEVSLMKGLEESVAWFSDPKNIQHYRRDEYAI